MRDYLFIDRYLDELEKDIYPQPPDQLHTARAEDAIDWGLNHISDRIDTVLDVGCGEGFCAEFFDGYGINWTGISLGDSDIKKSEVEIIRMDISFLIFEDESYDMIFSRHVLEHSPMPLLTLMEWHRVSKTWLLLILPDPQYLTYVGRNHYSVMPPTHVRWLLRRAGWFVKYKKYKDEELRYLCVKRNRLGEEGFAEAPVNYEVYEADRDDKIITAS